MRQDDVMDERDWKLAPETGDLEQVFQHRLQLALQAGNLGIWDLDLQTGVCFYSDQYKRMLGYEPAEIPDTVDAFFGLLHPDDSVSTQAPFEAHLRGETPLYRMEFRLRHRDGSWRWIRSQGRADRDGAGRALRVSGIHVDITEIKQAEEALRKSEERLRFHVENTTLAVVEWDAEFHVTRWSGQAERMFGWPAGEMLGKHISDLHMIYHEDLSLVDDVMRRLSDGVTRQVVGMNRNVTRDGRVLHCRWYNSVLADEQGRMESVMSLVEDCTAGVQAEQLLREAKRLAEEANAAKRQFLASMSHEMRTPLTAIIGFTELLADRHASTDQQREYLQAAQRNARMLLTLVDNVLDFSKIEAGKMEVAPRDCSLHEILRDVVAATELNAEKKHLRLELNCRYPLPETIRTDPLRLWQILVNLVSNAIKFTERGGVWITVKLEAEEPAGNRLRFTVGDTGPGVAPEFEGRLFEPFAQAEAALAPGAVGVGLGLPIAARLAELLGSRLELDHRSAQGASFSFALDPGPLEDRPMLWAAPGAQAQAADIPSPPADRLEGRLLVAEDAIDTQQLLRAHLQHAGLQVDVVDDGLAAVRRVLAAAASGASYDLVLLDLQMPHLDGYEAARLLRASAWSGPLLALSAHSTTDDRDRCRVAGFDQFLPKPVTRERLLAVVQRYLPARSGRAGETAMAGVSAPVEQAAGALDSRFSSSSVSAAAPARPGLPAQAAPPTDAAQAGAAPEAPQQAEWDDLLALFAKRLPPRLELLARALRDQNRKQLSQAAHQLAGAAAQFGFPPLEAAARALDRGAVEQAPWTELASLLAAVHAAVPASLRTSASAPPPSAATPRVKSAKRSRVLLADDDALVRAALRLLVDRLPDFEVVAEAADGREALECLRQHQPEIALMDIAMPHLDGLNATARVAAVAPQTKVIILSALAGQETVLQALQAGAAGYLLKNAGPVELERALSSVVRGGTYYGVGVSEHVPAQPAG